MVDHGSFSRLISAIWKESDAIPFRYPVKFKELGLLDYPIIIKNPIDLSTIRKNLKNNNYHTLRSLMDDIDLIWRNCKQYNVEGSEIYKQADRMEKTVKRIISNMLKNRKKVGASSKDVRTEKIGNSNLEEEIGLEEHRFKDKIKFAQIFKAIKKEDLKEIIRIIKINNNNAINIVSDEKMEIKVDNINSVTFNKVFNFYEELKKEME